MRNGIHFVGNAKSLDGDRLGLPLRSVLTPTLANLLSPRVVLAVFVAHCSRYCCSGELRGRAHGAARAREGGGCAPSLRWIV